MATQWETMGRRANILHKLQATGGEKRERTVAEWQELEQKETDKQKGQRTTDEGRRTIE